MHKNHEFKQEENDMKKKKGKNITVCKIFVNENGYKRDKLRGLNIIFWMSEFVRVFVMEILPF